MGSYSWAQVFVCQAARIKPPPPPMASTAIPPPPVRPAPRPPPLAAPQGQSTTVGLATYNVGAAHPKAFTSAAQKPGFSEKLYQDVQDLTGCSDIVGLQEVSSTWLDTVVQSLPLGCRPRAEIRSALTLLFLLSRPTPPSPCFPHPPPPPPPRPPRPPIGPTATD